MPETIRQTSMPKSATARVNARAFSVVRRAILPRLARSATARIPAF
ncbi:MAG: hypothetical protein LBI02_10905 [Opitutaceae bacterium]|nr:hypothetical protein [Opitutaceae bacterium]